MTTKLIGVDAARQRLTIPRGSPYVAELRVKLADGNFADLSARDYALTIYGGGDDVQIASVAAVAGADATRRVMTLPASAGLAALGASDARWEIAEMFSGGKVPMLGGVLLVARAAASAAGDGTYPAGPPFDALEYSPATDTLVVVPTGAPGTSPQIVLGSVTTVAAADSASATIDNSDPAFPVLDLAIPRGPAASGTVNGQVELQPKLFATLTPPGTGNSAIAFVTDEASGPGLVYWNSPAWYRIATDGLATAVSVFDFSLGLMPPNAAFQRLSSASAYNAAGGLISVGADVARFDYDPTTLVRRGVLIEPQASNLVPNSDGALATLSTAVNVSDEAGTIAGFTNAIRMIDNGAVSRNAYRLAAQTNGLTYTFSFFIKMDSGGAPVPSANVGLGDFVIFCNGVFATTWTVTALGGGIYRISTTYVFASDQRVGLIKYSTQSARGHRITGWQVELGTAPTSYIATAASAATRATDAMTLNWGARGVADGIISVRYTFDTGATQDATMTVAAGVAVLPTNLNRPWIKRVERL